VNSAAQTEPARVLAEIAAADLRPRNAEAIVLDWDNSVLAILFKKGRHAMFGSAIIDSAIGVIFGFLAVSLFTSAIVEAINSALKLRAKNLRSAIKELVNDPGFGGYAKALYEHALISPFGPGAGAPPPPKGLDALMAKSYDLGKVIIGRGAKGIAPGTFYRDSKFMPSYIDKSQFAQAFLDVVGLTEPLTNASNLASATNAAAKALKAAAAAQAAPDPIVAATAAIDASLSAIQNDQIRNFLKGVVARAGGDLETAEKQVADWFDSSMDRLSGTFKRKTQFWTFWIALACAALINIDAIHIGRQIWAHPELAHNINMSDLGKLDPANEAAEIDQVATWLGDDFPAGWPGAPFHVVDAGSAPVKAAAQTQTTAAPDTPAIETKRATRLMRPGEFGAALLGWLITAFAALFGAPFWFDTLQSVVRLKGAGPSPQEKKDGSAAAA
jgi:hypothetical protein